MEAGVRKSGLTGAAHAARGREEGCRAGRPEELPWNPTRPTRPVMALLGASKEARGAVLTLARSQSALQFSIVATGSATLCALPCLQIECCQGASECVQ
jgi:hypothetical protein